MFNDINSPQPNEIKFWMSEIKLNIDEASVALGISKRQFLRFLSGDTKAKKVHALAMQMLWLIDENNRKLNMLRPKKNEKIIKIEIK